MRLVLSSFEAKLLYLAVAYQLALPGWEPDDPYSSAGNMLVPITQAMEPYLGQENLILEITPEQGRVISEAIPRVVNELRTYTMMDEMVRTGQVQQQQGGVRHRRSIVKGFEKTLHRLFPEVRPDPEYTDVLAGGIVALRRRLTSALAEAEAEAAQATAPPHEEPRKQGRRWRLWHR